MSALVQEGYSAGSPDHTEYFQKALTFSDMTVNILTAFM